MAKVPDFHVEGFTRFSLNPTTSYRYVISLQNDQLNVWLEDRSSKKQWQTGLLSKEDYVTAANACADASGADYVSCFKQCLNSPLGEDEDVKRTLLPQNGGKMKLDLSLKIRLLLFARNIHYIFELNPIAVERIDILESKMKDLQEEVQRGNKSSVGTTAFLFVDSEVMTDSKLQWKEKTANSFAFNEDNTSIKILVPGVYAIGLVVNQPYTSSKRKSGENFAAGE